MALYAFDGTWNREKTGEDVENQNTNVVRFRNAYEKNTGKKQFYVAGVGTRFDHIGAALGGVFGLGELPRINEAYDALCKAWVAGDTDIDIVGFSRGADGVYRDPAGQRFSVEVRSTGGDDFRDKELLSITDQWQRTGVGAEPVFIPR